MEAQIQPTSLHIYSLSNYNINNSLSILTSPQLNPDLGYNNIILTNNLSYSKSPNNKKSTSTQLYNTLININKDIAEKKNPALTPLSLKEFQGNF